MVKDLHESLPAEVAEDVRNIVCTEDPMNSLSIFLGSSAETAAVSDVVSKNFVNKKMVISFHITSSNAY